MIQNNNNDEKDDDYDHLSQLATSWTYKIITTMPLHANNLNKSLFSSALKSLFISDKSKTNIFHVFHAIALNNNPVTFEENVNVCFNVVIETFMQEHVNDENVVKSMSMLKQKINNDVGFHMLFLMVCWIVYLIMMMLPLLIVIVTE